jgi:uncharacterized protein HemX
MGQFEKQKMARKADRMSDPHGWAQRVDEELTAKMILPFLLMVAVIGLGFAVWALWQDNADMAFRIQVIEDFLIEKFPTQPS